MSQRDNPTYVVGYKKPPIHSRFRKGGSGNPGGRPKGVRNLKTEFIEELNEKLPVTVRGKRQTFSKQRIALKTLVAAAMKGDIRAASKLVEFWLKFQALDDSAPADRELSSADQEILAAFVERYANQGRRHAQRRKR